MLNFFTPKDSTLNLKFGDQYNRNSPLFIENAMKLFLKKKQEVGGVQHEWGLWQQTLKWQQHHDFGPGATILVIHNH